MPPSTVLSDQELIRLIKKGDRAALTEVYKRYAESLAGLSRKIGIGPPQTGHNSNQLVEQLKVLNDLKVA